jgi:hypothetical protein
MVHQVHLAMSVILTTIRLWPQRPLNILDELLNRRDWTIGFGINEYFLSLCPWHLLYLHDCLGRKYLTSIFRARIIDAWNR